jgi:hypothetical protein
MDTLANHKTELFASDPVLRKYLQDKLPAQYQTFQHDFAANSRLTWFEGRFSNAILVFDPTANYLGYVALPVGEENPVAAITKGKKGAAAAGAASGSAASGTAASGAASASVASGVSG